MTKSTGVKKAFCETQFPIPGVEWLDDMGMLPLAEGRFARLEVATFGIANQMTRISVTVLSRETGKLDQKDFHFADYLSERSDTRTDYDEGFQITGHYAGYGWYIAVPKSTAPICEAIGRYLEHFRQASANEELMPANLRVVMEQLETAKELLQTARSMIRDTAHDWPEGELCMVPKAFCKQASAFLGDGYDFETGETQDERVTRP